MRICVYNAPDSGISPAVFARAVYACALQLQRDVAPAWGLERPQVEPLAAPADLPLGAALVVVARSSDVAGAAGYHTEERGGVRALVATEGQDEAGFSVTLSHELAELLVDPAVGGYERVGGRLVSREVCDPVEGDSYTVDLIDIGLASARVQVSNFVNPAWFDDFGEPGARLDMMGLCARPGEVRREQGGYVALSDGTTDPPDLASRLPARKRHPLARIARRLAGPGPGGHRGATVSPRWYHYMAALAFFGFALWMLWPRARACLRERCETRVIVPQAVERCVCLEEAP